MKNRQKKIRLILFVLLVLALVTLYVVNVSRAGSKVEGCPESCAKVLARVEGPVRILSLNDSINSGICVITPGLVSFLRSAHKTIF